MVKRQIVSQTPNTRYEDKAPAGYTGNVAAPAHERGKATWNMWVYEGGKLILKSYGITVSNTTPTVLPGSGCLTMVDSIFVHAEYFCDLLGVMCFFVALNKQLSGFIVQHFAHFFISL